MDKFEHLQ